MSTLTLYCRYTIGRLVFIAGSVVIANMAFAGEITYPLDSYITGDTLTADDLNAKFNEIKSAVNNNNSKSTLNDLSCTDGQVAKWNGTNSAWECVGAAGVAFESSTSFVEIPASLTTIQSVSLTAPGPGQVIVSFSASYIMNHTFDARDQIQIGISDLESVDVSTLSSRRLLILASGFATGEFDGSVASHAVFTVTGAGTFTYYVLGLSNRSDSSMFVSHPATQAVFVPNNYQ